MTNAQQSSPTSKEALQNLILDPDLGRLEDHLAEFNLFDVLGIARRELQHSAFLAWLLDPRGSHGLRDYFLRGFLSRAARDAHDQGISAPTPFHVDAWRFHDIEVATERHYIDILLLDRSDGFVCSIENKVNIGEHSDQLRRSLETIEEEYAGLDPFPIFLAPKETTPQSEEDAERYVRFTYQEIAQLISKVLDTRGSTISTDVASFLKQYNRTLRRHVLDAKDKDNLEEDNIEELAYQIYNNHKAAIDVIISAKKAKPSIDWDVTGTIVEEYAPDLRPYPIPVTATEHNFYSEGLEEIPELKGGGFKSGRALRFAFRHPGDKLGLILEIGPADQKTRERLYQLTRRRELPFKKVQKLTTKYTIIYNRPILGQSYYDPFDPDKAKPKVEQAIREFYENDYWPMVNAIREEFGLGAMTAG